MQLDARKHYNPDPLYLRALLRRSGLSQREAAEVIGIAPRRLERNLRTGTKYQADYRTQACLEWLAERNPAMVSGVDGDGTSPDKVSAPAGETAE